MHDGLAFFCFTVLYYALPVTAMLLISFCFSFFQVPVEYRLGSLGGVVFYYEDVQLLNIGS